MSIEFACECGTQMTAAQQHGGLLARCPECASVLRVPLPPAVETPKEEAPDAAPIPAEREQPPAAHAPQSEGIDATATTEPEPPDAPAPTAEEATAPEPAQQPEPHPAPPPVVEQPEGICAMCGEETPPLASLFCIHCHSSYHPACWEESRGCAVPVCTAGPGSRKKVSRAPVVEDKLRPCPVCAEMIPEHAHRCRYCGDFTRREMRKVGKPRVSHPTVGSKRAGVALILSLLSLFPLGSFGTSPLYFLAIAILPFLAVGIAIWAMLGIRARRGEMSGNGIASVAIVIGVICIYKVFASLF